MSTGGVNSTHLDEERAIDMSLPQPNTLADTIAKSDEVLDIFFDQGFVPQAFVDILLTNAAGHGLSQAQTVSSSLLSRLDYYTKNLTRELESTIKKLENLSGTLPMAWASEDLTENNESKSLARTSSGRPSKLEYYLDTLGGAVRAIDGDLSKIDSQMLEINGQYADSRDTAEKLRRLELIKGRLEKALHTFLTLKSILDISTTSVAKNPDSQLTISVTELKVSLKTLEDTIGQSLEESLHKEDATERNQELLDKIDLFVNLKPLFKGFNDFQPVYTEFTQNVGIQVQNYLSVKDLGGELTV